MQPTVVSLLFAIAFAPVQGRVDGPTALDRPAVPLTLEKMDGALLEVLRSQPPGTMTHAILFLDEQCDLAQMERELDRAKASRMERHYTVVRALRDKAESTQGDLCQYLETLRGEGRIAGFTPMWISNAVALEGPAHEFALLAGRNDVARIYLDRPVKNDDNEPPEHTLAEEDGGIERLSQPEPGLVAIGAPDVWALGITGQGSLVSSLDTGVQGQHAALGSRWRGHDPAYTGHPEWAWFDPLTNTTFPREFGGHGTATMGIICGGSPGDSIGVAPGAQWITAGVLSRSSGLSVEISLIMQALQWTMDPDGDPTTVHDVPDVSSNSWGLTDETGIQACDQSFWSFIDAVEAAGTVVVFSAGNQGLAGLARPADRARDELQSLSVGAVNGVNPLHPVWSNSSRGPSFCTLDGCPAVKPELAAPGIGVRTSILYLGVGSPYGSRTGTSYACPHVAGTIALMREANPNATVKQIKRLLLETATDLGSPGNDNDYGYGMVNALAAVQAVLAEIHVPADQPTLADAVAIALDGSRIVVADGTYTGPSNRRLQVTKHLTIASENGPAGCVIDCEDQDVGFSITTSNARVTLEGLTIRRGKAVLSQGSLENVGGAVAVRNGAHAVLRDCVIEDSRAFWGGGGIAFVDGGSLLVERSILRRNAVPFTSGIANGGGIGIRTNSGSTEVRILNSIIADNASFREGGGIAIDNSLGSSAFTLELRNCTIANNRVTGGSPGELGGGLFLLEHAQGQPGWNVQDCILWGNEVLDASTGSLGDQLAFALCCGTTAIRYCDVEGGPLDVYNLDQAVQWGPGNIDSDPVFQNPLADYHIKKYSPCVNKGDPAVLPCTDELDLDAQPRVFGGRIEIGADERLGGAAQNP